MAFYKARFADASNFTFVFVGSFKPETIKPLVETYLASLPATNAHETWRDLGIAPPSGVVEKTVEMGIAPKSEVAIVFSGAFPYDDSHRLAMRALTMVLQSRLFDTIRQELGGTYSIEVNPYMRKFPRPEYNVRIDWTCDPARTTALVQRVFEEIEFVKRTSFSPGQVVRIRDALARDFEQDSQDNGYLLNQIARRYEEGDAEHVAAAVEMRGLIAALTGEAIQDAARTYLDTSNYVKVTMMPKGK
jgi:zinc protease